MVYARGTSLKFYINGFLMWSGTASGPASGRLGVLTWRPTGLTEPTYVDWAVAGMPVLPTAAEQVVPVQIPYESTQGGHSSKP